MIPFITFISAAITDAACFRTLLQERAEDLIHLEIESWGIGEFDARQQQGIVATDILIKVEDQPDGSYNWTIGYLDEVDHLTGTSSEYKDMMEELAEHVITLAQLMDVRHIA